jgi:hypothetical protein
MRPVSRAGLLSLLAASLLSACGGGSDGVGATQTSNSGPTQTTNTQATQTTTTTRQTTTTSSANTTTTSFNDTTTTSSTTTTTGSNTTTTLGGALPPLAKTPTVLKPQEPLGMMYWGDGDTAEGGKGQSFGQTDCVPYEWMSKNYFVKPHISIFVDGQRLAIPRYIGLLSTCIYEIHNHDNSGVMHVFGTGYKYHTLGDLFSIWGQPLTWNNVAGLTGKPVEIFVENNGSLRRQTGNPGDIELTDHVSITIQIGTPLQEIPVYDWSQYPEDE